MMGSELTALALAALLQGGQIAIYSIAANRQLGRDTALGPRDSAPALTGTAGRLQRALINHFEGLILFTIGVLLVTATGKTSLLTEGCAWAYLGARILYVPAYAFGWTPWRSFIWALGFGATMILILASLF